jgi:hypothetical protein
MRSVRTVAGIAAVVGLIALCLLVPSAWLGFLVVFVACPLNWIVAVLLWRLSRQSPDLTVIRDRAIAATAIAFAVTVFATLMLNTDWTLGLFDLDQARVFSRIATLILALAPTLFFLRLYFDPSES